MFLDLHTHQVQQKSGVLSIQSLSLTESTFLAMPKTKPISIGIHPWYGKLEDLTKNMKYLRVLAKQDNVKLIGECGLDKLRGEAITNQLQLLEAQLSLAEELQKPVIIHCVKAFDELIAIKNRMNLSMPLIIHGFSKKKELARQLTNHGFYLSFGAAVLISKGVQETLQQLDAPFFLETDDSQIAIEEIYIKVAEIKKITIDDLKDVIFANWKKIGL